MNINKLLIAMLLFNTIIAFAQKPASDPDGKWVKVEELSDEFNGPFNHSKWDNNVADWGDWSWEPENTWIKDGNIVLRMQYDEHQRGGVTKYYTSGIIKSKAKAQLYGYFEAKMKGATRFPGVCPAFWLYKHTSTLWTEIDIMEMQENSWNVHRLDMNTHTFIPERRVERRHWDAPWDPKDDFHVYGCKWDKDGITWYIDGVQRAYRANELWHQALDVTLSMGLREPLKENPSSYGFPTTFETDYIRVWTYDPDGIFYELKVNGGSSGGTYKPNTVVSIFAEQALPGQTFDKWVGAVENVADVSAANTIITMPDSAIEISATYRNLKVDSLVLDKQTLSMVKGTNTRLELNVYAENPSEIPIVWSSENAEIATVDGNGLVQAIAVGTTKIVAANSTSGKADTCLIEVIEVFADSIQINKTAIKLLKGEEEQLTVSIYPAVVSDSLISWSSENVNVASVSSLGLVIANKSGNTKVIAINLASGKSDTCLVEVNEVLADSIVLEKIEIFMDENSKGTVSATFYPSNVTDKKVRWTTDNRHIASVVSYNDTTGTIFAKIKGTTTITAQTSDGKTASCKVYVGQHLDVNSATKPKINIFPNPVNDFLNIEGFEAKAYNIKIVSLMGKVFKNIKIQSGEKAAIIYLLDVPAGNYIVTISSNNNEVLSSQILSIVR